MRKIINSIIIISILATSVFSYDILEEAIVKTAPASTLEEVDSEGNVISTSYYSGGGSVTFEFLEAPTPWITLSPPSIEAGCNGIDMKGMFMKLLGIDQLGEQLQNAGASLAYGVAIGLIYSLPGIAKAFEFIRKWAKEIQSLLADSCSSGIKIGMALGEMAGSNLPDMMSTMNESMNTFDKGITEFLQKGKSGILEAFGISGTFPSTVPELGLSEKNAAIVALFRGALESDSSVLGILLTDLATKSGASTAAFEDLVVVKEAKTAISVSSFYIIAGDTAEGTKGEDDYKIGADQLANAASGSLTGKEMTRLNIFSYVLMYNFIGDLGISSPQQSAFDRLFGISADSNGTSNSGSGTTEQERLDTASQFNQAMKTKFIKRAVVGPGKSVSAQDAGKALANYIWMGTSAAANRAAGRKPSSSGEFSIKINGKLKAPKATIYTLTLINETKKAFIPVLSLKGADDVLYFRNDSQKKFKGVLDQATCIVDVLVDGNGTIDPNSGCGVVPFVFPEMHKYIKVIKNSPNFEKPRLKNILVLSMASNMANAILSSIDNSFSQMSENTSKLIKEYGVSNNVSIDTPETTAKGAANLMLLLVQKKGEAMSYAKQILREELSGGFELKTKIEGLFTEQAIKNRERGLKSLQK